MQTLEEVVKDVIAKGRSVNFSATRVMVVDPVGRSARAEINSKMPLAEVVGELDQLLTQSNGISTDKKSKTGI
jgi:hypothetical protein